MNIFNRWAMAICAVGCCAWAAVCTLKYVRFDYWGWDLSLYAQLMWNLCHGHTTTSLFGGSFLIDHANYIAFLLVPLYFFFQSALTLLYFKLIAFFIGSYVLYLIAQKRLGGAWALGLMLAYIFYPANVAMLFFEFNFENLALPLIFASFYFLEQRRWLPFIICALVLALVKENMPLVVAMFGVYGLFACRGGRVRFGLVPLVLGIGMFVVEIFVLQPLWMKGLSHQDSGYWQYLYGALGNSPTEILTAVVTQPAKIVNILITPNNCSYLASLTGPLLPWAVLSPHVLFLGLPLFLQDLLASFDGQKSIYYFHAATLTVFIFLATIRSLARFPKTYGNILLALTVAAAFVYSGWYLPQWNKKIPWENKLSHTARYEVLSKIPSGEGVMANYTFFYPLSQRKDLYIFSRQDTAFSHQSQHIPDTVRYAALDFTTSFDDKAYVKKVLLNPSWRAVTAMDEMVLLEKDGLSKLRLLESQGVPFNEAQQPLLTLNPFLELNQAHISSSVPSKARILSTIYYWHALQNLPPRFKVELKIIKDGKVFYSKTRNIAYGMFLNQGEYIKDMFNYLLPEIPAGTYQIEIRISQGGKTLPSKPFIQELQVQP